MQFIIRPDFEIRVQESEHPAALLYNRSSVKHMISRIKREPSAFERYQHNRDLVALINSFACHDRDLPPAWESRLDANGKVIGRLRELRGCVNTQLKFAQCIS